MCTLNQSLWNRKLELPKEQCCIGKYSSQLINKLDISHWPLNDLFFCNCHIHWVISSCCKSERVSSWFQHLQQLPLPPSYWCVQLLNGRAQWMCQMLLKCAHGQDGRQQTEDEMLIRYKKKHFHCQVSIWRGCLARLSNVQLWRCSKATAQGPGLALKLHFMNLGSPFHLNLFPSIFTYSVGLQTILTNGN